MRAIPFFPILAASLLSTCLVVPPATAAGQASRRLAEARPDIAGLDLYDGHPRSGRSGQGAADPPTIY